MFTSMLTPKFFLAISTSVPACDMATKVLSKLIEILVAPKAKRRDVAAQNLGRQNGVNVEQQ